MSDPIAVIIRFNGDPDDLLERFEKVRQAWIEAQDGDYSPPAFYAVCKTDEGIVIVDGWKATPPTRPSAGGWVPTSRRSEWGRPITSSIYGSRSSAGTE
jgi:hypothetical protein